MGFNKWIERFSQIGGDPSDSEDEKAQKSTLVVMSFPFSMVGLTMGSFLFSQEQYVAGWIPFGYFLFSIVNFLFFAIYKRYSFFRATQLLSLLILPFLIHIALGGYTYSSVSFIWAFMCPLGALVFLEIKKARFWFWAFMLFSAFGFLSSGFLQKQHAESPPQAFIDTMFFLNISGVSVLIYLVMVYFLSGQNKLKKEIKDQAEKLKELDKVKSRFFANISHEFRTPLTLIQGMLDKKVRSGKSDKDLLTMQRNSDRLLQLINQLLDLSKIESGEIKLQVQQNDILVFVKKLTGMFESAASSKGVKILFNNNTLPNTDSSPFLISYFDQDKVHKMITNLLSNAVKFTPEGEQIKVNVSRKNENIRIAVSNSGSTIESGDLERLFDRFYQVDNSLTRSHEGSGIGLSLVKELTEIHHGSIEVTSPQNTIEFTITLPQTYEDEFISDHQPLDISDSTIQSKTPEINTEVPNSESEKLVVLVVEDNPDLQEYIKDMLQEHYDVIQALNGKDGLELAKNQIPDLIISDLMMPVMDGFALCQALKSDELTNHIPLVILTAKSDMEGKIEGLEAGADDYLTKPFNHSELMVRMSNLIHIRKTLQGKYAGTVSLKPDEVKVDSSQSKFLNQVKEAIENNLSNDQFGVEDLCADLGTSRSQLHRKLKAVTDQSTTHFIRNYRLYRAEDLLKQGGGNISEIAYAVGFNSQTYFSSSFKELFGYAPTQLLKP